MPGYTSDTPGNTRPWGTQAFNGVRTGPTESGFADLSTYPDVSGPSQAINPQLTAPDNVAALAATAGMTIDASVTQVAAVTEAATAGMTIAATSAAPTPTLLQSAVAGGQSGITHVTLQYPNNVVSGSTLIAAISIGVGSTETITSVVDDLGNNFFKILETPFNVAGLVSLWVLNTPVGQVGHKPTITANKSGSGYGETVLIEEVSNLATGTTVAALCDGTPAYNQSTSATTTVTSVAYSSSVTGEYTISVYGDDGNSNHGIGAPSGWTKDPSSAGSGDVIPPGIGCPNSVGIAYKSSTGGSESPNAWTISNIEDWNQIVVAFQGSGGGGPATVTGSATLSGSAGMTVGASINQLAAVTLAGGAALNVSPLVTELAVVSMAATAGMTPTGVTTRLGTVALSATAGLTPTGTETPLGIVTLSGTTTVTIAASVTEMAVVALASTAAMTVASLVTQVATILFAASGSLTTSAKATQIAAVTEAAVTSLSLSVLVTIQAGVITESATASMTVAALVTQIASVVELGASGDMVVGSVLELAAVSLTGTTVMTVGAVISRMGAVSLSASAALSPTGVTTQFGTVTLIGTTGLTTTAIVSGAGNSFLASALAGMTVAGVITEVAGISLSASAALNFAGNLPQTITGQVALAPYASLLVAGFLVQNDAIVMAAITALSATLDYLPKTFYGDVQMSSTASMVIPGATEEFAVIQAVAVASLDMEATVRVAGSNVFTGVSTMRVDVTTSPGVKVNMAASTSMVVRGTAIPVGPPPAPSLADQIAAVVGQDPVLLGATGYLDDVFTSRLTGDSE